LETCWVAVLNRKITPISQEIGISKTFVRRTTMEIKFDPNDAKLQALHDAMIAQMKIVPALSREATIQNIEFLLTNVVKLGARGLFMSFSDIERANSAISWLEKILDSGIYDRFLSERRVSLRELKPEVKNMIDEINRREIARVKLYKSRQKQAAFAEILFAATERPECWVSLNKTEVMELVEEALTRLFEPQGVESLIDSYCAGDMKIFMAWLVIQILESGFYNDLLFMQEVTKEEIDGVMKNAQNIYILFTAQAAGGMKH